MTQDHAPTQMILFINDIHFPFEDKNCLKLILKFIAEKPFDEVVINGDMVDFPSLSSKFYQAPLDPAGLDREVRLVRDFLGALRSVLPADAKITWLGGNHEDRLWRWVERKRSNWLDLGKKATQLVMDALSMDTLFDLPEFDCAYHPYGIDYKVGKLHTTHGNIIRSQSAYTARGIFEKRGVSTMVGHTHRLGAHFKTNLNGTHAVWENGCLCLLKPKYLQDPDWQQGFAVGHIHADGMFNVQQIPFLGKGKRRMFYYGDRKWVL